MKENISLIYCLLLCTGLIYAQPNIPPPAQTDEIIIDNGASGKADPNDRIRYKVTIQNTGAGGANGTQLNIVPDPRTTFVPGSFRSSPLALPDSYTCTGNVGITVSAASGLKANDFDDNTAGLTITAGTFATTQGGSIMISADGSFMYTPPAGYTGNDTYTYTLNDGNGVGGGVPTTDVAVVTITISNLIWFIDNISMAATSDGRLTSPFKTLADFNSGSTAAGNVIYIEHTGTNYTGGIVLQDNEHLYGEGHTGAANLSGVLPFALAPNSKTLPNINGSRPIITNAAGDGLTLAMNNNLRGFDVGNCSDFGMDNSGTNSIGNLVVSEVSITNTTGGGFDASNGSGASTNAVFSSISSTGGVNGIDLTNCAGTFTVNGGTITNPTGTGVLISGGTVVFSFSGAITDNSGFAVDIDNHDSGNVTFSGNITSTGTGIRVQNCGGGTKTFSGSSKSLTTTTNNAVSLLSNTGATITFSNGGLVISTTTGTGFNATGGASGITVTGSGNTISSGTGTALNVANSTIGSGNLNFQSIAANGGTNGIVLNTTGSSGGLTVTGTGTTDGSGGTIQNTTNRGASFISAANISLKNMNFTNAGISDLDADNSGLSTGDNLLTNASIHLQSVTTAALDNLNITGGAEQGINGNAVSNFSLLNSTILNAGNEPDEDGIHFYNMSGTCAITNTTINCTVATPNTTGGDDHMNLQTTSGTLTLAISGGSATNANKGSGYLFGIRGTTNATINFSNATSTTNFSGGIVADVFDNATMNLTVSNSTSSGNNDQLSVSAGDNSHVELVANGNTLSSVASGDFVAISLLGSAFDNGFVLDANLSNNMITVANGLTADGIISFNAGGGAMNIAIANNTINYAGTQRAIIFQAGQDGSGSTNATVTGNAIDIQLDGTGNAVTGILAQSAITGPGNTSSMCVDIGGAGGLSNTFTHSLGGTMAGGDIRVRQRNDGTVRLPGYAGGATDTAAVISYLNGRNVEVSSSTATADSSGFSGGGACTQP